MAEGSSLDSQELCADAPSLVEKVLLAQEPERSDAWKELLERCIKPIAQVIAPRIRLRGRLLADFQDGYAGKIYESLRQFDPQKGKFSTWCYTVIHRWGVDLGRREKVRRTREILETELISPQESIETSDRNLLESYLGLAARDSRALEPWEIVVAREPLSPRQIQLLESLPPLRRVIICAVADWPGKIPPAIWQQWVQKAKLDKPFPPSELADYDDPFDRLRFVAEYLGIQYSTLRQHWYRALEVLREVFRLEESE